MEIVTDTISIKVIKELPTSKIIIEHNYMYLSERKLHLYHHNY